MNDIPPSPKTQSFKEKHKGRLRVLEKMLDKELLWLKRGCAIEIVRCRARPIDS